MRLSKNVLLSLAAVLVAAALGISDVEAQCFPTPPSTTGTPCCSLGKLSFSSTDAFQWSTPIAGCFQAYDVARGDLVVARAAGQVVPTNTSCQLDNVNGTAMVDATIPPLGGGFWYLVRTSNLPSGWTWNQTIPSQIVDRDSTAMLNTCPL